MALTKISTDGVKDDAITKAKIPADQIETSELGNDCVTNAQVADNAIQTENILDQQVTLAKLPHGDSNNDGKFLRANNGADPSFETVSIPASVGGANGVTFNDDIKAEFGTGGDLDIWHTGSDGNITNGTGDLKIGCSNNVEINTFDGHKAAKFINDGAVELYHDGTKMVETFANGLVFPANKGICFENNTTSSASGVSNQDNDEIFNYYEFGDWTPVTNGAGMSMSASGGHYMRMGALVWVGCNMTFGSQSGGGTISIGGLPFATGSNVFGGGSVKYSNISPSSYDGIIMIHLDSGATTLHFPNISISEASGKRLDWSAVYPVYNF